MGVMLTSIVLTSIKNGWGLSLVTMELLTSAGYVDMFFGAVGCGFLSDLVGRKKHTRDTTYTNCTYRYYSALQEKTSQNTNPMSTHY